ncbi:MAG: DUF5320 domain-containing protein [Desulfobacterales bacterium]
MPGHDGTGPKGEGPMTGRGSGYCLLKIPHSPDEPKIGFAGLSGKPVALLPKRPRCKKGNIKRISKKRKIDQ